MTTPTERSGFDRLIPVVPGEREIPAPERPMVGLLRLIAEPAFGDSPPEGLREILGPLRPLGEGVSRLAASDRPGCRKLGTLAPRSRVEAPGERLIEGVPVEPDRSGRVMPAEGLREIEEGDRDAPDDDPEGVREVPEGERSIEGTELRGKDGVRGAPDELPALRPNSLVSEGDRPTEGLDERPTSEPVLRDRLGEFDEFDGERVTDGERDGELKRESLPNDGRLTWPSGRVMEGEFVDRLGESRN